MCNISLDTTTYRVFTSFNFLLLYSVVTLHITKHKYISQMKIFENSRAQYIHVMKNRNTSCLVHHSLSTLLVQMHRYPLDKPIKERTMWQWPLHDQMYSDLNRCITLSNESKWAKTQLKDNPKWLMELGQDDAGWEGHAYPHHPGCSLRVCLAYLIRSYKECSMKL